jgi:heme exporter protein C
VLVPCLLAAAILLIFLAAPTEATMGEVQKILYLHVSVAWCSLAGCLAMGLCGALYLFSRDLGWDHGARAMGEVGWLCSTLNLVTGSLWAQEAWGVWWTWEPRLTSSAVLWLVYAGIVVVRSSLDDPHRRARTAAVLAVLGVADIPLVVMATRWFRGVHPVAPEMDGQMRLVLLVSIVSFTTFFVFLALQRRRQLALVEQVEALEAQADAARRTAEGFRWEH